MKPSIAVKNDLLRQTMLPTLGRVVMTQGVNESPAKEEIITAVRNFTDFNKDNNPHKERDFGKVTVGGTDYFWKIDYYDENYEYFQEDGHRVLTIMRADEY